MKILVLGGMHGNEPLGPSVAALFRQKPVQGIDVVLGNQEAIAANSRFIAQDLNRSFPGDRNSKDYEFRRAAELLELAANYDLVLDFHNTNCPKNDCGFVGEEASPFLYDVAQWFGLRRIIVADYDCLNKYASKCLSVEISLDSERMDAEWWYRKISQLGYRNKLPAASNTETYRFVYRMTIADRDRLKLPDRQLRAFQPIDDALAQAMGVKSPAYPIFIGDKYTPYNYGGLLNKRN